MAKTTPVPGAASSGAASGSLPPFGSFEQFLFEVITLRSSAAYRADIDKLMEYEDQPAPYNDWVKMFEPGDRAERRHRHGQIDLVFGVGSQQHGGVAIAVLAEALAGICELESAN